MFKNYFKTAVRSLWKNRKLSFINIFGLATGMACSLMIFLFVSDESSYDRFNADADRIYRVVKDFVNDDGSRLPDATTPPALAPAMLANIPEVQYATRVFPSWGFKNLFSYQDKNFLEERLFRVDSSFFDIFSFPFVEGNPGTAFTQTNNILLTQSMAKKYFGNAEPIGKVIHTDALGELTVSGVLRDVPPNAHFHFDFLISTKKFGGNINEQWGWYNFYTYIKLKPNSQVASLDSKIMALYQKNNPEGKNFFYSQPLTGIHLTSDLKWEIEPNGSKLYVYIFSIIALFVVSIACINYINLATAKSAMRAKEIGVRKVSGASKASLVRQFLTESLVTVFSAFLLGLLIAWQLLPAINQLTEKNLSLSSVIDPLTIAILISTVVFIGLVAGIYPALYLSSFKPVLVLKGFANPEKNIFNLRKVLVVLQFSISVVLIIGTLVVVQQIKYIQNAKLGLDKDQVMIVNNAGTLSRSNREAMLSEIAKMNGVKYAATANGVVGGQNWTSNLKLKGSQTAQLVNFIGVSYGYLSVLDIKIKEGRNFSPAFPSDTLTSGKRGTTERIAGGIILNERAIKDLGIPEPAVGHLVSWDADHDTTWYVRIVGVAKDFHFASFKSEIKPFAFVINNEWQNNFTLKVAPANLPGTISAIEKKWKVFSPEHPFQYSFLDETFASQYKSEQRFNKVFLYMTTLAIIIACLGLFGLTAFMVERRTKEIGIRKVIGASVASIVTLLSKDFIRLVIISFVIGCPLAWYFMNKWLENFVYRIQINWWIFILAGMIAVLVALITVSFQAVKAATLNPVKSLKTD